MMRVEKDKVVSFNYVIKDDKGSVIDNSHGVEPLSFIYGCGQVLAGLEDAMKGKNIDDYFSVTIAPEKAYGLRDTNKVRVLGRELFGDEPLFVGMQFNMLSVNGSAQDEMITIVGIKDNNITVDGNHLMAGARLNFEINIVAIRYASPEELLTGQVHHDAGTSGKVPGLIALLSC